MAYTQKKNPFPVTSCGRRRTYMQDGGKSPLKTHKGGKSHTSDKATYGYSESGEFTQTGGKPRNKFLKPLSNYNANERRQLIKSGTIKIPKKDLPTGEGSSAYLLGGNTAMKNYVDKANQKVKK